jgi:predicted DNA-binding protein
MTDDSLDFLDKIEQQAAKRPAKGRGRAFNTGLETVSHKAAARATGGKSMAGHYKRYTAYLSPESIDRLKAIAEEMGLSQAETARWFIEHMIALYDEGLRPETEVAVVRRRVKRG